MKKMDLLSPVSEVERFLALQTQQRRLMRSVVAAPGESSYAILDGAAAATRFDQRSDGVHSCLLNL